MKAKKAMRILLKFGDSGYCEDCKGSNRKELQSIELEGKSDLTWSVPN